LREIEMTNEQILKLAKSCECEAFAVIQERNDEPDGVYYQFWEEQLLKFAQAIYSEGFSDGRREGSYSDYIWMKP
jgi:hypothetical protein